MPNEIAENVVAKPEERASRLCWHLITSEYPPQNGGVSNYTEGIAEGLAAQGDEVHVWCPPSPGTSPRQDGVVVHRELGAFTPADLRRVGAELDGFPGRRRLLVQWVPHGYGYRSMNVGFCWWLWKRAARHGDQVELIVHEAFLFFNWSSLRQCAAAVVHRFMTMILLRTASRVWMSVPGWEKVLRPYALGRKMPFRWLPVPSNIPVADDPGGVEAVRRRYITGTKLLIGHFGTYGLGMAKLLEAILSGFAKGRPDAVILLTGNGSERFRGELIKKHPHLDPLIQATGALEAGELACHLAACDLLIQPYEDGISTRRTSMMAGLANGKPMVSTIGWLTEPLWFESRAVALVPGGDTAAFVEQMHRLSMDAAERRRLASASRQLYRERFDLSHTVSSLRGPKTEDGRCALS